LTVTLIVALVIVDAPLESVAVHVRVTGPLKFAAGVYVTDPSPLSTTVPPAAPVHDTLITVLSMSVAAVTVTAWSSGVLVVLLTATGRSFTGVTVIDTIALELNDPSLAE
jgi:hypothetical protein